MDRFWAAPPVTRTLVAAMFVESLLVYGGLLDYSLIWFHPSVAIFKLPPQIWRFPTSFLLTGPKFAFIFDLYFTWLYSNALELNSPRFSRPGDYFTFITFVGTIIMATANFFLGARIFTHPLIMALTYLYALDNRGTKAHFVIVQIPVEFLPWANLCLTLLLNGWGAALVDLTGIIAAHLYDFLTRLYPTFQGGRNYIWTPVFVKRWFGADQSSFSQKKYGTSFRAGQDLNTRPSGSAPGAAPLPKSWTSGFSTGAGWTGRGQGRRLGSD